MNNVDGRRDGVQIFLGTTAATSRGKSTSGQMRGGELFLTFWRTHQVTHVCDRYLVGRAISGSGQDVTRPSDSEPAMSAAQIKTSRPSHISPEVASPLTVTTTAAAVHDIRHVAQRQPEAGLPHLRVRSPPLLRSLVLNAFTYRSCGTALFSDGTHEPPLSLATC